MTERYTIHQITHYLTGCLFAGKWVPEANMALRQAIALLDDRQDGIAAVCARRKQRGQQGPAGEARPEP